jgi:hypothetical protein
MFFSADCVRYTGSNFQSAFYYEEETPLSFRKVLPRCLLCCAQGSILSPCLYSTYSLPEKPENSGHIVLGLAFVAYQPNKYIKLFLGCILVMPRTPDIDWGSLEPMSYSASVKNFYNSASTLERFDNKSMFFCAVKHSSLPQRWRCSCKFRSGRIGSRLAKLSVIVERGNAALWPLPLIN